LLPYAGREQAEALAADLRRVISETNLQMTEQPALRLSVSIGVAVIDLNSTSDDDILALADRAMYADKREGTQGSGNSVPDPRSVGRPTPDLVG